MTLTELLVVLAILGILLLLAFPALKPLFAKTYALEAKTNLRHLAQLQKIFHMEHLRYSAEFAPLGYEHAALVNQENGTAHYRVEIFHADAEAFRARAVAVTDFDGDGTFNVWEVDQGGIPREVIGD